MTVLDLLTRLRSLDVNLRVDGESLRFDAPPGVMTPALRETLQSQKAQLVAYLQQLQADDDGPRALPRTGPMPVSFGQRRLWFLQQLDPESGLYNLPGAIRLSGPLDVSALRDSLAEIQRRHEVLRTTFSLVNDEPVQQIHGDVDLVLPCTDLAELTEAERSRRLTDLTSQWSRQSFDLGTGPLMHVRLVRTGEREHVLLLAFHHIVCDGWSIGVFVRELTELYGAFAEGRTSPLQDLTLQYADFARWQREHLQGAVLARHLEDRRHQLAGPLPVLELPTDRPRPAVQTFNGRLHGFAVPDATLGGLEALSREQGATLFMTLLTAFNVLLFRYSGQKDIVVGSPVANRMRPELEPLLGFFVNSLALRTRLSSALRFTEALARVKESCLGAFEHQDVPFERLVEEIRPDRAPGYSPLYQVMFALQTAPGGSLQLPNLTIAPIQLEALTAKFDLTLSMKQTSSGLLGVIEYNTDLFEGSTIERMAATFCELLGAVVAASDRRIEELTLLSGSDKQALAAGGRGRASGYPATTTVAALFATQVVRRPMAVALEADGGQWTYADVGAAAGRIAGALERTGVGPNVAVGVWLTRGAPLLWTLAGILGAGGAYVPLDVSQPAARGARMWAAAGVRVVVTSAALAGSVPGGPWQVVTLEEAETGTAQGPETAGWGGGATADDLAYVVFTSGSTGEPKGVAVPQRAVVRLVWAPDYVALGPSTVLGQAATPAFDAATFEIWGAWLHGGRLVLLPADVVVAPTALGEAIRRGGVTTLFLTTALVHQIGREAPGALAGLDTLLFGGEAVEPRWIAALQAAGGPRRVVHVYGPTEVTTFATWQAVGAVEADALTLPIGGPIVDTQAYVLDAGGALAPVGALGELYLGGAGLAQGYVGAARVTAEKFVPDGVSGAVGARLYRTGDLVRWTAPGTLVFVGRRDGQVKLRGYRIEIAEVEAALAAVAGVGASVVVVEGTGRDRRLVGYVAPAPGATVTVASVREALKGLVPGYMVPAALVVLAALPLNANGKVDRPGLPPPEAAGPVPGEGRAPRGEVEGRIATVWREVLQVAAVGVDENFFDAGGHSLLLVRVQTGLAAALGQRVPLVTLFQYPTIASLAAHLTDVVAPAPARPGRAAPLSGEGIAVIGMAGRFPGAPDIATWWARLCAGEELLHRFSDDELAASGVPAAVRAQPAYVPVRGILEGVEEFDAGLFGYAPRDAALLDPQQRLLLECAWTALETAGYAPGARASGVRVGVYAGTSANTYVNAIGRAALAGAGPLQVLLASDKDFLATRVSYKLQLTGPSVTVQTACSTSLVAVHTACQALQAGECDVALAGGVSVTVPSAGYLYHPEGIASPDGHCRPFDAAAAGTVAGNGVALVVLKPLRRALEAGDQIQAVIRGTAINNDGADKVGFTAPSVTGQAAVVAAAVAAAGVEPASIGYVEAHGTGTALGDPVEVAALRQVFGPGAGEGTCGLGSVKGNVGHLDAAAGVTGLIKTVLAVAHGVLPPSLHFTAPHPECALGPFFVPTRLTPWPARAGTPRRAGVSAFGMGGTNAHVIVEEAPGAVGPEPGRAWQVVPVSGQTPAAAAAGAAQLAAWLEGAGAGVALAEVAYTLQVGRAALPVRRVAVGPDGATVAAALRTAVDERLPAGRRPLVWLFPGQGPAVRGAGAALYASERVFRAELEACGAAVAPWLGEELGAVLYGAAGDAALDAVWTQVGVVAIELSLAALWASWGLEPTLVVGHSVGELAAAVVAGVLTREAALTLTVRRAQAMAAAPAGGMLAVAAEAAAVTPWLEDGVSVAAINGPRQTVVAGGPAGLAAVAARLEAAGLAVQRLATQGAFHSALMAGVAAPLTAVAATLAHRAPQGVWVSSVTGARVDGVAPGYWGAQVRAPVQWRAAVATARALAGAGPVWLEVGPGRTLTHLVRGAAGETAVASLGEADAAAAMARALGTLWAAGCAPDWRAYHAGARRQRVALPTYPFQRQRYWLEAPPAPGPAPSAWTKQPDVASWFYRMSWKQGAPLGTAHASPERRRWLVLGDETGVAQQMRFRLSAEGHATILVQIADRLVCQREAYAVRTTVPGDLHALFHALDEAGEFPTDIVHCWGIDRAPSDQPPAPADVDDRCFHSLLTLAQLLAPRALSSPLRLHVVTSQVHAVTGAEDLCPAKSVVIGPCRTISAECPGLSCTHVDIEWPEGDWKRRRAIDALIAELRTEAPGSLIAHRGAYRWLQTFEPIAGPAAEAGAARLRERGVYLITGGLGGVGMTLAGTLVDLVRARVVLVGRTPFPPRSEWLAYLDDRRDPEVADRIEQLLALESAGGDVLVINADVASEGAMAAVLTQVHARFGPVQGIVHAAGIGGDGIIALKRRADAEAVLSPKVTGTQVLARVFEREPLDFIVLCSSLTSVLGGVGQVDYCAANAFLDSYAQAGWCAGDERTVSIAWDTWRDVGMAVDGVVPSFLADRKAQILGSGITVAEGRELFLRALALRLPHVVVCTKDLGSFITAVAAGARSEPPSAATVARTSRHARPALTTAYVAPEQELDRIVCSAFEDALGVEAIGIHDNFFELGGHSLLAVDLMSELNRRLGTSVPVAALYEGLTPRAVAGLFGRDRNGHAASRETAETDRRQARGARQAGASRRRNARMERRPRHDS